MKILTLIAIFVLQFASVEKANAGTPHLRQDSLLCLRIKGRVTNEDLKDGAPCKVELITSSGVVDSLFLQDGKNKFSFQLRRNLHYAIRVSREGYVSRLLIVNTEFPSDIEDLCEFAFVTRLISNEEASELNEDALDFPIGIVHFNKRTEMFTHNQEYTQHIRQEISSKPQKMYSSAVASKSVNH